MSFLPERLRPSQDPANPNPQGMPGLNEGAVMTGGTWYCDSHVPGVQQAGARKEFLIANAPLSSALIAEVMGQQRAA